MRFAPEDTKAGSIAIRTTESPEGTWRSGFILQSIKLLRGRWANTALDAGGTSRAVVEHWPAWADDSASTLAQRLLELARHIKPGQVATSKRGPKVKKTWEWGDGATARTHLSTARVIKASKGKRP